MKRLSIVFSVLLVFFTLASSVSASPSEDKYTLQPSLNTDVVFEDVDLVSDGDEFTFTITQKFEAEEKVSSEYDIEVDLDNLTYTVKEQETQSMENSPSIASTGKYFFVSAKTYDPIGIELNNTQAKLWWSTGSSATKIASEKVCTPSKYPTTWYNSSCIFSTDTSIDGGKNLQLGVNGSYYNYDFLSSNKRTDVNHYIYLEGYADGTSWYTVNWNKSGEASGLLHFGTGVTKN